jgi:C4-dicarboxylate-binding protein DctP
MISRRSLLGTAAGAAVVTGFPYVARGAPIVMKLPHATAEVHPGHISAVLFKQELEKRLPGKVTVQIFPNRQLGDDRQNLESVMAGTTELGLASTVLVPLVAKRVSFDAWQLPFVIRDYDHFYRLTETPVAQKILDDLEPAGLVGLAVKDIGQRNFLSATRPVRSTADFQGLKTRIVPVPLHKDIWEAVGTNPIGLPYGEVYSAMQTKVIDAVEINVSSILGENLWEVGKHLTLTGHYPWPSLIAANKPFFDRQPPEIQQALREAGRACIKGTLEYAKKQDLEARKDLQAKGVQIHELSDLPAMKQKMRPILDKWAQRSPLIAEFIKTAEATS